jgi:hypothetical protein
MQDLWRHLADIRTTCAHNFRPYQNAHPTSPPPMEYLSTFPTQRPPQGVVRCRALNNNPLSVTEMFQLRRYERVSHRFEKVEKLTAIMHEITSHKEHGIEAADIAKALKMNILNIKSAYI